MNLSKILKNSFDSFFIFKAISIIGILIALSIILIMIFTTLGMWKESINIVPNQKNIIIAENNPQSSLTARKLREWEQLELVNKYWDSINNSNADIAVSLLTDKYKIIKEEASTTLGLVGLNDINDITSNIVIDSTVNKVNY